MKSLYKIGLVILVSVLGCHGADLHGQAESPMVPGELHVNADLAHGGQIRIEPVQTMNEVATVRTSGRATFNEERLSYVSAPLVGRMTEIRVKPGERVEAGRVLAVIDSPDLAAAWSEFIKARADLVLAQREHDLARQLWDAKAMARKDLQKAADERLKTQTDVRRTRERLVSLGVAEAALDRPLETLHVQSLFNLSAPVAGTVVERTLTLGQLVGGDAAQRLFVLADLTELWVSADVYEKDLPLVHPGEEVSVHTAAWPQEPFRGHIDYVGDTVDSSSRTVKVRLTGANDRFLRRPVTLGSRMADRVTIAAGLSATDRVVTDGSILLKAEADHLANG